MGKHPAWLGKALQTGGRANQSDPEVRQSATDRARQLRSDADKLRDGSLGKSASGLVPAVAGAVIKGLAKNKTLGNVALRTGQALGAIGPISGGVDLAESVKKRYVDAPEADKTAAGEERKRGGRASKKKD